MHFSTSHDALVSSVQMLLPELESARFFIGVSFFFTGATTLSCKLNGIIFITQVLSTRGLRSLLSKRVKKQDYCFAEIPDECIEKNGWQRGLWEFGKPHVDIGLAAVA